MSDYFGDTGYWIALIDSDDELYESAGRYERLIAARKRSDNNHPIGAQLDTKPSEWNQRTTASSRR